MERIAFIYGETFIYWNSIILILGIATAICMFLFLYLREKNNGISAALLVAISTVISILFARAVHWYCRTDAYASLEAALTEFTGGGYALMGAFAACILTAVLLRLIRVVRNLPMTLDCLSLGAAAGICVGRLACLYTSADRGPLVEKFDSLPFVYPVANSVTGVIEYRLATFMLQSMAVGIIFLVLLVFYLWPRKKHARLKDGDTTLLFLLVYGCSQVVLDSTRYDSLFMRSNGFISIVQILGAVSIVLAIVLFSIRMVKARGFKWWQVLLWVLDVACIGGAGFMEYWVQRHGNLGVFCYSIMSACLAGIILLTCLIRILAVSGERKKALVESTKK